MRKILTRLKGVFGKVLRRKRALWKTSLHLAKMSREFPPTRIGE